MSIHTVARNIFLGAALLFMTPVYAQAPTQPDKALPTIQFMVSDGGLTADTPRAKEAATKLIAFLKKEDGVNVVESDDVDRDAQETVDITFISIPESNSPGSEALTVLLGVHEPGEEYFIYLTSLEGELDKTVTSDDVVGTILNAIVKNYGRYLSHQGHAQPQSSPKPAGQRSHQA